MPGLAMLQQRLGYQFKDVSLLKHALTHRSTHKHNNERLEFLGDAILSFIMANELYQRYADLDEGELSRVRSGLVNGEMLAQLARELNLGLHLQLGQGELKSGGRERDSILADAIEAMIGAIYLDGGLDAVKAFILGLFGEDDFDDWKNIKLKKDPKSALQEWLQAQSYPLPTYEAEITGEAHAQTFHVACSVVGLAHRTTGESTNRRKAERMAAAAFLKLIGDL